MRNKLFTIALAFIMTVSSPWSTAVAFGAEAVTAETGKPDTIDASADGFSDIRTNENPEDDTPDESLMAESPYMTSAVNNDEAFVADVEINPAYDDVVLPEELAVLTKEEQELLESIAADESIEVSQRVPGDSGEPVFFLASSAHVESDESEALYLDGNPAALTNYADTAVSIVSQFQSRAESITLSIDITTGDELSSEYAAIDLRTDIDADTKWREKYAVFYRYVWRNALSHNRDHPTWGDYMAYQYGGYTASYLGTKSTGDGAVHFSGTLTYRMYKVDSAGSSTGSHYYTTAEQEAELTAVLDPIMADLCPEGLSDEEKLRAIYDYICKNVSYDYSSSSYLKYTAYAALINKSSVCQGYSSLFYRMALTVGIDARIVSGYGKTGASSGGNHAWSLMKLGDAYYLGDTTWDAGKSSYSYLLKGEKSFGTNHIANNSNSRVVINGYTTGARPNWFDETEFPTDDENWDAALSMQLYSVSFDGNGAEEGGSMEPQSFARQRLTTPGLSSALNPCLWRRYEYRFDGWNLAPDGTGKVLDDGAMLTLSIFGTEKNLSLYARWTKLPVPNAPRVYSAEGREIISGAELDIDETVYIRSTTDENLPVYYTMAYGGIEPSDPDGITGLTVDDERGLSWDRQAMPDGEVSVTVVIKVRTGATEDYARSSIREYTFVLQTWGDITEADRAGFADFSSFMAERSSRPVWIAPLPTEKERPEMYSYTGEALNWGSALHIYDVKRRLIEGTDYSVTYTNNLNAGTARVNVTYKGNYTGSERITWEIARADISGADFSVEGTVTGEDGKEYLYSAETGEEQRPVPVVRWNDRVLKSGSEFTVNYSGNFTTAGTAELILRGTGNFTGERSLDFVIEQGKVPQDEINVTNISMSSVKIKGFKSRIAFDKNGASQNSLKLRTKDGTPLVEGVDFTVSYILPRDADGALGVGTATVVFTGTGGAKTAENSATDGSLVRYYGTVKKTCTVNGTSMSRVKLQGFVKEVVYDGEVKIQDFSAAGVAVWSDSERLVQGTDFTVSYSPKEPSDAGKVTVTLTGKGGYTGKLKRNYRIKRISFSEVGERLAVDIVSETQTGDGAIPWVYYLKGGSKPVPEVKLDIPGETSLSLKKGTDYKIKYYGNKTLGSGAYLRLTGKGNYSGKTDRIYFGVVAKPLSSAEITVTTPVAVYKNKNGYGFVKPVLKDENGKRLINGKDYIINGYTRTEKQEDGSVKQVEVTRSEILEPGERLSINLEAKDGGNYSGKRAISYTIVKGDISGAKVSLTPGRFAYTGKRIRPVDNAEAALSVKLKDGTKLSMGEDFIIRYGTNTAVGNGTMTIVGTGNYGGTKTVKFKITRRRVN